MRLALPAKPQPPRSEQIILFRAGGQLFAISSASVQEVRSVDSITSAGKEVSLPALPKVQHFVQRGEASLFVVDAATHFGLPPSTPALVFVLRRTRTALLIDGIDRMTSMTRLQALPQTFCHEERDWYRGLTVLERSVIPVVKPEGFLTPDELFALDAALLQTESAAQNESPADSPNDSGDDDAKPAIDFDLRADAADASMIP
jgi:chemotaxis signal transduction protein